MPERRRFYTDEELFWMPEHFALEDLPRRELQVALGLGHNAVSLMRTGRYPLTKKHRVRLRAYIQRRLEMTEARR